MSLRGRLIQDTEKDQFNDFIAGHPKGHILQSYHWGEVKALTGWEPIRLVIEEDDKMVAAVSLLKRTLPVMNKSIFYAPRGPVVDFEDEKLFKFLLDQIATVAREHGAILLKIDPDIPAPNEKVTSMLKKNGFRPAGDEEGGFEGIQPRYVFRLDITPSMDELFMNLHSKTRYNVRLARRKGVEIKQDCTLQDLQDFYKILKITAERDKFLIRSYDYFKIIWDQLVENGLAKLFMAYYQGKPIAGTLAFIMGDIAWYIYGASSNEHRNVMPNYLLQWTMIEWAKNNGCKIYDFRGVPGKLTEDNPLYGLYRFKKGFNGEYTQFIGEYDLVYSPLYYRLWNIGEPVYQKGVRRLINLRKKLRGK
ncbi:MAG: peptidoglycan bridge formation glycyltransferase FemA/FemB family protein [Thermoanaerobacteraceae bacterium]|nr:peptidoglycan bridge formation glycyltransferase FemA/FemB family protein [Thermoanaerobacteraceae bacterium]